MAVTVKNVAIVGSTSNVTSAAIPLDAGAQDGDSLIVVIVRVQNGVSSSATPGVTRVNGASGGATSNPIGEVYTKHNLLAADAGGTAMTITWATIRPWKAVVIRTEALKDNDATFTAFAANNSGGDVTLAPPAVTATAAGLGLAIALGSHGHVRTWSAGTECSDADINATGTNSCHIHVATYDIAAPGSATAPTSTRDDASTTAGSWPKVNVSFVADSTNALPTVTAIAREVVARVGEPITFGVTASDPDGTIASYSIARKQSNTVPLPTITNNGDGTFTWTPAASEEFGYSFVITATDNSGGTNSADVAVMVVPANGLVVATAGGVARVRATIG